MLSIAKGGRVCVAPWQLQLLWCVTNGTQRSGPGERSVGSSKDGNFQRQRHVERKSAHCGVRYIIGIWSWTRKAAQRNQDIDNWGTKLTCRLHKLKDTKSKENRTRGCGSCGYPCHHKRNCTASYQEVTPHRHLGNSQQKSSQLAIELDNVDVYKRMELNGKQAPC